MRLEGKTAVVTAAGAGIGQAIAMAFRAEGAEVIATDLREDALGPLAEAGCRTERLNVADPGEITAFADRVGTPDVLANCAGFVHHGTILDCGEDDFEFSVTLNIRAMYRVTRAFVPGMLDAGGASIVNIASVCSSLLGLPNRFIYGTTKAGVIGLTKAVAADFMTQGIRCNAICPGTVDSPSLRERMKAGGDYEATRAAFVARQPMGRIADASEIAALAVYLASDESAFMTGQAIAIDGGMTVS